MLALRGGAPAPAFDNPMLERATSAERIGFTAGNRLRNWEAGMRAFAERPLLGWGSGNYYTASGRHLSAPDGRAKVRDHAHNLFVEEAASRGLAGLAAWLALWGLTGLVVLRAARRLEDPRERALAVFAGAALAGWFAQGLTSFYSAESWLQHMLLLAFLAHLETRALGGARGLRWVSAAARLAAWLRLPLSRGQAPLPPQPAQPARVKRTGP
ncbi:MAG: O-antigen ligase family protein, partial [Alphaproteobacteria bacterium]|nr:O-antigen ligase family protein [Alphaproteobacteria bacterium]